MSIPIRPYFLEPSVWIINASYLPGYFAMLSLSGNTTLKTAFESNLLGIQSKSECNSIIPSLSRFF
jgi:hypothetical protein